MPVEVGVDVRGDVDAARSRRVEDPNETIGVPPQIAHAELHVGDLDGELRLAADRDDLVDRLPEREVLAPDVADVSAAERRGDFGKGDDFTRVGVNAGVVL